MPIPLRPCRRMLLLVAAAASLSGCDGFEEMARDQLAAKPDARVLAIGDSVMWWHSGEDGSIADAVAAGLGEPVVNLAVPGAAISHPDPGMAIEGLDIRAQYRDLGWHWVLLQGGANDLAEDGALRGCDAVLDDLVSADGQRGEIPDLVRTIRADGARVVAFGYYRLPDAGEPHGPCDDSLETLSDRLDIMASRDPGVLFVAMADVVDPADGAAFDADAIHPSARTSRRVGDLAAGAIAEAERR